ncbi:MAG: phage adaptor protein [Candidatus Heimdallarchaeaceae archaeon]
MSRTLSTMRTNVGVNVQDTSSTFGTYINTWINKRYQQILRRINWNYINEDYTISVVAGTQDYVLPTDFKTPLYAVDITNGNRLTYVDPQDLADNYPSGLTSSGSALRYTIFNSDDDSKYLRLHYNPNSSFTLALPYIVKPDALTNDSDTNVLDIEDLIEQGATADAWRFKRQFAKARVIEALFEKELAEYIFAQENQQDRRIMFKPDVYNRDNLY